MMSWIGSIIIVLLFIALFKLFRLLPISQEAISHARDAVLIVQDTSLSDRQKEKLTQQSALKLFKSFVLITVGGSASVFLPVIVIWLISYVGLMSFEQVLENTLSVPFLVGSSVMGCLLVWITHKK